ncbi:Arginase/deacetylase [Gonapodya prolifera JEL478]|uniref:Arginase/deacetylase n=1 Tax=Gonapodya prolifera (strain JEL478) TaxID=1344416 RepID=A0A139AWW5_GONPJ|nr:Arginase/deacetylase [Gonapodya prolifera JEL478]|eukprot:KXS21194.1 Arginase/deacetylase [Gonapodya prolifera JEL478]
MPLLKCIDENAEKFDIGVLGIPFDTAVTYRPGARFGPAAIRTGSRRIQYAKGYDTNWGFSPFSQWAKVVDCGDLPITGFSNTKAYDQMYRGYLHLITRPPRHTFPGVVTHPRYVTFGGDHSISYPILKALHEVYGPIAVLHFDSHLDTWRAPASATKEEELHHGTMFWHAWRDGLTQHGKNVHVGIRTRLVDEGDYADDKKFGWKIIEFVEYYKLGIDGIIREIKETIGEAPCYLSLDIDVVNPGEAPATGTIEPGGFLAREIQAILRGLNGLNIVGADVVEVAPVYDHAEITATLAANLAFDMLATMVKRPVAIKADAVTHVEL